jgi:hypothetical protein
MVVILDVLGQEPPQMSLVQDNHVVQAFTANTPDQPFDVGVLSRTPGGDYHFFDPYILHPLPKRGAVDMISVSQEIPWRLVPGECVHDLLRGPRRGGMLSDGNMDDPSAVMGYDQQDEQNFVCHGRHHKEI